MIRDPLDLVVAVIVLVTIAALVSWALLGCLECAAC